jgi:hypothetical protein
LADFRDFFLFGFVDASLAVLPRVSRVRAPPATRSTTGRPRRLVFLPPRPTGGPAPTSPASEPLIRSGRNFLTWWPTRRPVRPPSFVALRRRRPVRRRFRMLPPNRRIFDFFPPFFESHFSPDGPRSTPIAPTRRSPPAASVGRRFDRCRGTIFRTVVEKRRFCPFSDFLSPADRPLRAVTASRLAPSRAPTPGVRRREPCVVRGADFLRGAKNRFSPTLGAPPKSPYPRTLSGRRFSSLPPSAESDGEDRVRIGPRLAILPLGSRRVPDTFAALQEFRLLSRWRTVNSVGGLPAAARLRPRLTRAHVQTCSRRPRHRRNRKFLHLVGASYFFLHGCFRRCRNCRSVSDRCKTATASTTTTTTEYLETSDSCVFLCVFAYFSYFRHGVLRRYCHPALHRPCLYRAKSSSGISFTVFPVLSRA